MIFLHFENSLPHGEANYSLAWKFRISYKENTYSILYPTFGKLRWYKGDTEIVAIYESPESAYVCLFYTTLQRTQKIQHSCVKENNCKIDLLLQPHFSRNREREGESSVTFLKNHD